MKSQDHPHYYIGSPPSVTKSFSLPSPSGSPVYDYGSPNYTSSMYTPPTPQILTPAAIPASAKPIPLICPYCHRSIVTRIQPKIGLITWVGSLIGLVGFPLFCCLYPFCFDITKDVEHTCPSCGHVLALYQRL